MCIVCADLAGRLEGSTFAEGGGAGFGMRDPLAFSEEIESLSLDTRKAVMGGNLEKLLADA